MKGISYVDELELIAVPNNNGKQISFLSINGVIKQTLNTNLPYVSKFNKF